MKLITQEVNYLGPCSLNFSEGLKRIEQMGRICYKSSTSKITEESSKKFISRLLKPTPSHSSVLEHSNLIFSTSAPKMIGHFKNIVKGYFNTSFISVRILNGKIYIYGNYRAFYEFLSTVIPNPDFFSLPSQVISNCPFNLTHETSPSHLPREVMAYSAIFKTDRAVTHELVRHRRCAFSQESQRYVKYSGNMEFIRPHWFSNASEFQRDELRRALFLSEQSYTELRNSGLAPEEARSVLPNQTATTIGVTAYLEEWQWILYLRTSRAAYPQIRNLLLPLANEFNIPFLNRISECLKDKK